MKQMLIRRQEQLTQTAVLENGRLTEFYMEETTGRHLVGNIYKGRVVNVLPGMQAAFVDIGQGKNAFLYVDDLLPPHLEQQPKEKPPIASLVKPGQSVLVQVSKEALGGKGARVTTHYSLPGRYLVYMPLAGYIGVSKKIGSEQERERLKHLAGRLKTEEEGVILRTVASERVSRNFRMICFSSGPNGSKLIKKRTMFRFRPSCTLRPDLCSGW